MRLIDLINEPWAIKSEKLEELVAYYSRHLSGEKLDLQAIKEHRADLGIDFGTEERPYQVVDGVALIPVTGVLSRRLSFFAWIFGGRSTVDIGDAVQHAVNDAEVRAILLDVDSPGGTVSGTQELAQIVFDAREAKNVVAYTGGTMASAAYWIASAANRIYISGGTNIVGSIGVLTTHVDRSQMLSDAGLQVTEFTGGRWKDKPSAFRPLDEDDRAHVQYTVDALYTAFVEDVARNRGATPAQVLENMAEGRLFVGRDAIEAGLVDDVMSWSDVIAAALDSEGATAPVFVPRPAAVPEEPDEETSDVDAAVPADASTSQTDTEDHQVELKDLTLDNLRAERPDLYGAVLKQGAENERNRITAIDACAMPGHEDLVAKLKADGATSGPEAAVQILKAEKAAQAQALSDLEADAPAPAASAEPDTPAPKIKDDDPNVPLKERAQAAWDASADLRAEFGSEFDTYFAFRQAEENGQVRRLVGNREGA